MGEKITSFFFFFTYLKYSLFFFLPISVYFSVPVYFSKGNSSLCCKSCWNQFNCGAVFIDY